VLKMEAAGPSGPSLLTYQCAVRQDSSKSSPENVSVMCLDVASSCKNGCRFNDLSQKFIGREGVTKDVDMRHCPLDGRLMEPF
jgi:hypothetical protein